MDTRSLGSTGRIPTDSIFSVNNGDEKKRSVRGKEAHNRQAGCGILDRDNFLVVSSTGDCAMCAIREENPSRLDESRKNLLTKLPWKKHLMPTTAGISESLICSSYVNFTSPITGEAPVVALNSMRTN